MSFFVEDFVCWIVFVGYSDNVGSLDNNMKLFEKCVMLVVVYLIDWFGVFVD